jgi:hypothetical protein
MTSSELIPAVEVTIVFKSGVTKTFLTKIFEVGRNAVGNRVLNWTDLGRGREENLQMLELADVSAIFTQKIEVPA